MWFTNWSDFIFLLFVKGRKTLPPRGASCNFLSSAEDANRVRGCYKVCFPSIGGLGPFILDVEGGGEPVVSLWDSVGFEIGRAAISLNQSPLATSCGVSTSGWPVCYSADISPDSGMAIS